MNKILGIILGLILLLAPIYDWMTNTTGLNIGIAAVEILKGTITWILIIIGILLLVLNITGLKE